MTIKSKCLALILLSTINELVLPSDFNLSHLSMKLAGQRFGLLSHESFHHTYNVIASKINVSQVKHL